MRTYSKWNKVLSTYYDKTLSLYVDKTYNLIIDVIIAN